MTNRLILSMFFLLGALPVRAHAQAGPPLITNDPDTPGAGNWEINLAATGVQSDGSVELSLPDLDINYGVGERIQLSVHLGTAWAHGSDNPWATGAGPVELAMRYRFLDEETSGFSLAVQPHWEKAWSRSAIDKGLASEHAAFGLPLQAARHFGKCVSGAELTRTFVTSEPDEWQLGVFWSRELSAPGRQVLAEAVAVRTDGQATTTLVNFGARQALGEHLVLLGSLGRELDTPGHGTLFYLGLQFLAGD
jgi:hypothetical protein